MLGEANFSDHGANRLGASALMQGLADGYFVIPYTTIATTWPTVKKAQKVDHGPRRDSRKRRTFASASTRSCSCIKGKRTVDAFHRELGLLMWDEVRHGAHRRGLKKAHGKIPALREEFWENVNVPGDANETRSTSRSNRAGRVADFSSSAN